MDRLQEAIAAIKAGNKTTGGRILAGIVRDDPRNEQAWMWLASAVEKPAQRRQCLERVLDINPLNERAHEALQRLELPPRNMTAMADNDKSEAVYWSDENATVTSTRIVIGGKTYATAHVSSVQAVVLKPNWRGPVILLVSGVLMCIFTIPFMKTLKDDWMCAVVPVLAIMTSLVILALQKKRYATRLAVTSGEVDAFMSPNLEYIQSLAAAISQAIVERG